MASIVVFKKSLKQFTKVFYNWDQEDDDPDKEHLDTNSLTSCDFEYIAVLKYIDFFTLYTTIPHRKLKKTFSLSFETPFFSKVEMGDTNTGILL